VVCGMVCGGRGEGFTRDSPEGANASETRVKIGLGAVSRQPARS
jgi:hypothetical protein